MTRGVRQKDLYPPNWKDIANLVKSRANWICEGCHAPHGKPPHVLTVHHIDFNPQNNDLSNLIALCQRCHLKVQGMMKQPTDRLEIIKRLAQQGRQLYFK